MINIDSLDYVANELGQPVGLEVSERAITEFPSEEAMFGRFCRLERLSSALHASDLFAANNSDQEGHNWTYLPYGPFADLHTYVDWVLATAKLSDPLFYAIVDAKTEKAVGVASYLRIDPKARSIEVGHLNFSPLLQGTAAATEAMFMMMLRAFESGYRRYEWKCNALNIPSRRAALRLGFSFEGVFRQAGVVKGRNRDTAWYAAIDSEWPALREAYLHWLDPSNFDGEGRQLASLRQFTSPILNSIG